MNIETAKRDALVMANARRLIKAKKSTSNVRLYMELFGTGFNTARQRCLNYLGIDPDSNVTSYSAMIDHIENIVYDFNIEQNI